MRRVTTEAPCENAVVSWAKKHGIHVRKMNGLGFNHWPDRMFCVPGGKPVFIEFKKPGLRDKPRMGQTVMQNDLREELIAYGYQCHVIDDRNDGIAILRAALEAGYIPEKGREIPARTRGGRPPAKARDAKDKLRTRRVQHPKA